MMEQSKYVIANEHHIGNVRHLEFPDTSNLETIDKQKLGYSQRQCYWKLSGSVVSENTVLNISFIKKQQKEIQEQENTWDKERNGNLFEQDYKNLNLDQKIQLERLHSIKDGMKFAIGGHALQSMNSEGLFPDDYKPLSPECMEIAAFKKNDDVTQADRLLLDKKFHLARILNYYDDHFAATDGELNPTVRALFLCETGFQQRGEAMDAISTELPKALDDLEQCQLAARMIDHLIRDELPQELAQKVRGSANNVVELSKLQEACSSAEYLNKIIGRLNQLETNKGAEQMIAALEGLQAYADKLGLTDKKAKYARQLMGEWCIHLDKMLNTSGVDIQNTQRKLQTSVAKPKYRILTESRSLGHKIGNALLFFPVLGWAVAGMKKLFTGSACFRSAGGSQRKGLERLAKSKDCLSFMQACQKQRTTSVEADAAAAA